MAKHPSPRKKKISLQPRNEEQSISSSIAANSDSPKLFPFFPKLPQELRTRIWEMVIEDGRIVLVRSATRDGLRSSVPLVLQVCSESRAVGLKQYALCFSATADPNLKDPNPKDRDTEDPDSEDPDSEGPDLEDPFPIPARVYFNFDWDTLYFREDWNEGVEGAWACMSWLRTMINEKDLQRVKAVGLDLKAKVCCLRSGSAHILDFSHWKGLKTVYLGLERPRLHPDSQIQFRALQSKDYWAFMLSYRRNHCWPRVSDLLDNAAALEYIKTETSAFCRGYGPSPEGMWERICPVHVVEL